MRDAYLIAKNELLVTVRNPYWLFHGIVQPIIYLVLFAPLLNGVAGVPGFPAHNAIQFFAPGLLIMNVLFSAGFEGFTLQDKVSNTGAACLFFFASCYRCLFVLRSAFVGIRRFGTGYRAGDFSLDA